MLPNEAEANPVVPANTLVALQAGREELADLFGKARQIDAEADALRGAGVTTDKLDLDLAETIVAIRERLNGLVDLLEKEAGDHYTPGLRVSHFVRELRSAQSALAAQGVIFARFTFALEQITGAAPNEPLPEESRA